MKKDTITIRPLGGLGEIGRNCTLLECNGEILIVDAGLMFPQDEMLGVDLVIPDFTYVLENKDRICGIVMTHGHEDHIGALPYLLAEVSAPVYATPLTRGLIEGRLRSNGLHKSAALHTMLPGDVLDLGPFQVMPYHVNHSIPDAVGFAIRTPQGLIVHSGDFKIDHTPLEGKTTDLAALARMANEGVILLMADSTNAESPGYTASERQLTEAFEHVFARAPGRIIVATFASLHSRAQLVIQTAARFGRKVAIAGRSMQQHVAIAEELGYLDFADEDRVALQEIGRLPDNEVCVLATGSQGEPNAALARMASGRFRHVQIREGDTVVLSAKTIPGNETQIHRNIDDLFRLGANVVYGEHAGLHVSGHAAQEELKLLLNLLRPLYFMPIHGAPRMQQVHARLAYALGYPPADVFVLDNGDSLELSDSGIIRGESLPLQQVYVDGSLVGDVGSTILRDRLALSRDGFVIARVGVNLRTGQVMSEPEIISQGFVYVPESGDLLRAAESTISDIVEQCVSNLSNADELSEVMKSRLEKLFYQETRRRPVVIPLVTAA